LAELVWTLDAIRDLDRIGEYIEHDSPAYAAVFVRKIVEAVENVRDFPRIGRIVPEFGDESLREVIFQNYRLIYRIAGDRAGVLAVWHSAMDVTRAAQRRRWDFT